MTFKRLGNTAVKDELTRSAGPPDRMKETKIPSPSSPPTMLKPRPEERRHKKSGIKFNGKNLGIIISEKQDQFQDYCKNFLLFYFLNRVFVLWL